MAITRRAMLEQLGAVGGAGATYAAMEALGLAWATPAGAESFALAPSSHRVILDYARRFNVPLESFVNTNRRAGWDFGGKVRRDGQMVMDLRGRIGELLADYAVVTLPMHPGRSRFLARGVSIGWGQVPCRKGRARSGRVAQAPSGRGAPNIPRFLNPKGRSCSRANICPMPAFGRKARPCRRTRR